MKVKNGSRIFPVHFQVKLKAENSLTGEKMIYRASGRAQSRKEEMLQIMLQAKSCGNIRITLDRCWIYDSLLILKWPVKGKGVQQTGVLPESHLLYVEVTRRTREFIADADEFSDRESGDDPSETYQIREYREKDSLHDIHWKLSAKADELQVKERARPLGSVVLVWLNLETDKKRKKKRNGVSDEVLANLLEAAASLSLSLLEEKCVHMVAWYEPENQTVCQKRVSREEHIYELLNRLLYVKPYQEQEMVRIQYEETFQETDFSTVVEFRLDGTVLVNGEAQMKLPAKGSMIKWEELYFVV